MVYTHLQSMLSRPILRAAALCCALVGAGCASTQPQPIASYMEMTDQDEAFARGAGREPTANTLYALAKLLTAQEKEFEAELVLKNCIERHPHYLPSYNELADLYVRQRKLDKALATIDAGLARSPNDPVLHNNKGMCHVLAERFSDALSEFTIASDAHPDDSRLVANKAMAAGMLGNYDESRNLYKTIVPPGEAHYNLGVLCQARGDEEQADIEFAMAKLYGVPHTKFYELDVD